MTVATVNESGVKIEGDDEPINIPFEHIYKAGWSDSIIPFEYLGAFCLLVSFMIIHVMLMPVWFFSTSIGQSVLLLYFLALIGGWWYVVQQSSPCLQIVTTDGRKHVFYLDSQSDLESIIGDMPSHIDIQEG